MTLLMNKLRQRNIEPLPFLNSSKPVWDLERSESKSSWITWSTWSQLHRKSWLLYYYWTTISSSLSLKEMK